MTGLVTLHLFKADLAPDRMHALLNWCIRAGADAFSVDFVGTPPAPEQLGEQFDRRLAGVELPPQIVPAVPDGQPGAGWSRPTRLWRLTTDSAQALWETFGSDGLFGYDVGDAWPEDPMIYRAGELMLGVITHEGEGLLRVRVDELPHITELGLAHREAGEWVDY